MTCEIYGHRVATKAVRGVFIKVCEQCGSTLETHSDLEARIEKLNSVSAYCLAEGNKDGAGIYKKQADELAALIGEEA